MNSKMPKSFLISRIIKAVDEFETLSDTQRMALTGALMGNLSAIEIFGYEEYAKKLNNLLTEKEK